MKTFVVLNTELHPDDLDFIVGVFQAKSSSEVERHLSNQGYYGEFDIREEELTKIN